MTVEGEGAGLLGVDCEEDLAVSVELEDSVVADVGDPEVGTVEEEV